ncbi:MAG: multicopper oxidase family protein [Nitrospinaceae bacterium]
MSKMDRRNLLKLGAWGLIASSSIGSWLYSQFSGRSGIAFAKDVASDVNFTPFQEDLPLPGDIPQVAPFNHTCQIPNLAEIDKPPKYHEVHVREATTQIVPGLDTEILGYNGLFPGPTLRSRRGEPAIVRFYNDSPVELSTHNHGGHQPSESDGFPIDLIHPGEFKDYYYPNINPVDPIPWTGDPKFNASDFPSTLWYHDHAMDITGENVYRGLAGFHLCKDELEEGLITDGVLPGDPYDIPLVIQDRKLAMDGSLVYEPKEDNFDGILGDLMVINGKAFPKFNVERKKYRFRILNGSNARWIELRLTHGGFLQVGNDSWLMGAAVGRQSIRLSPAERAEVIVDFRDAPQEVFLQNFLAMKDGRRPEDSVLDVGLPILKFVVDPGSAREDNVPNLEEGTELRPHLPIREDEIVKTREFEFNRSKGTWMINGKAFDPERDDATPKLGTAERWILKNGHGGWAHPVHIHSEAMQIQSFNGHPPAKQDSFKKDTIPLGRHDEAEVFVKFRTFSGRFVFHCHNLEHEDVFMMGKINVIA